MIELSFLGVQYYSLNFLTSDLPCRAAGAIGTCSINIHINNNFNTTITINIHFNTTINITMTISNSF